MIGSELIEPMIPVLKSEDSVLKALDLMEEFKLSCLPIVDDDNFTGLVSEEILLQSIDDNEAVGKFHMETEVIVSKNHHVLDILKTVLDKQLPMAVALDDQAKFFGVITFKGILNYFNQLSAFRSPGGILALSIKQSDYSLAEISRIVEVNGSKILSSYIQNQEANPEKLLLTLKLNSTGLSRIIAALERYEYSIVASFHEEDFDNDEKERLDLLFKYLDL